jgi:hypothetical protein
MLYDILPREKWEAIFHCLQSIIYDEFSKHKGHEEQNLALIFHNKVLERNRILLNEGGFDSRLILSSQLEVNGAALPTLDFWGDSLVDFFKTFRSPTVFTHGDFCSTNIFVDLETFEIKLIDPRGGFKRSSIYGPQIYDVAKLAHSIIGNYDLLLADQFTFNNCEGVISFDIYTDENSQLIEEIFWGKFISEGLQKREVFITTGLIMLGIPIFHLKDSSRAHAMYIRGLQLIQQGFSSID